MTRGMLIAVLNQRKVFTETGKVSPRYLDILYAKLALLQEILLHTQFLKYNAPIKARLRCLRDGISEQPLCQCGTVLQMRETGRFAGTFPSSCSNKCSAAKRFI